MPFWVYTWSAPLETLLVLVMVAVELGWGPAAAGVAAMLAVMPLQVGGGGRCGVEGVAGVCGGKDANV